MFIIISFIVLLTLSSATKSNGTEDNSDVLESWIKLDKTLKGTTQSVIKYLMPMLMESSSQVNLSSKCVKQSLQLVTGLRSLKKWAFSWLEPARDRRVQQGTDWGVFGRLGEFLGRKLVPESTRQNALRGVAGPLTVIDLRFWQVIPVRAKKKGVEWIATI
ncbi:hypothetical protein AVEN_243215-1 [Araneus ventricosus]|uniref:Uncharacterized protein n=1 Tax=Araneus ventricosus TaxID=182803 RepID=A0A4Y2ISS7_ARAVE|nr:hypothetical protein AVEN_243215-1 [Araneus ventricosus]